MRISYTSFTGGEISPSLAARYDMAKFKSSCRHLENFLPELHGPVRRRPGTYFLEDLGAFSVILPFEFSSDPAQNYVIVVQEGKVRLAQRGGFVTDEHGAPVEVPCPYAEAELYDISYAQSGDIVYLAHTRHPLRKLERHAHADWRMREVTFTPSIAAPDPVTVGFSTAGSYTLRYKVAAVNEKGEISAATTGQKAGAKHVNDWVTGDYATVTWQAVEDAESYLIYREEAGSYGLVGVARDGALSFRDDKYMANTADTPAIPANPFKDGNNPGVVCFHQQRLILASTAYRPQNWYGSRTGNYEDFSKSRPVKDDDSVEFTLASGRIDIIQWAAAFGDLLLGTAGSEYKAIGSDQGAITPSSLNVREQSYWGSVKLRPLIIGNSVLHVQRQGSRVRDLFYSLERDGYAGNDLSVMAPHLFDNHLVRQWDFQQSPGSSVWAVRDDGLMLVLTYLKEHDIWGWCRVSTEGAFRSVACTAGYLEDDLYAVVEREINGQTRWHLERFMPRWRESQGIEEAFYVDCGLSYHEPDRPISIVGGLDHLEGRTVNILADGSPVAAQVVERGTVVLPYAATTIHVGLPYRSLLCPQTPEAESPDQGATLGRLRSYGQCRVRLLESAGGKYGPSPQDLYELPFIPDQYSFPVPPYTGDLSFTPDTGFSAEGRLWIAQDQPLPFTIVALILDVDMQG